MIAGNVQKMKWNLKGSVKMKMKSGEMVNNIKVLYVPKATKNILIVSRIVSRGDASRATQDKITIKKNGVSMIQDTRKVKNERMMFYLMENATSPKNRCHSPICQRIRKTEMTKNNNVARS